MASVGHQRAPTKSSPSHLLLLPLSAPEKYVAPQREGGEGRRHCDVDAERSQTGGHRQQPGERELAEPEAEEIQTGGRPSVAGAVERALKTHAGRVDREGQADDPEG